jgi:beta-phosphoglucomutase-like phosphatase (HAD superfamily)
LNALGVSAEIPVVTRKEVQRAKPVADLFHAAAKKLSVGIHEAIVMGDSVWDLLAARRAGCLGIGVLSGGYVKNSKQPVLIVFIRIRKTCSITSMKSECAPFKVGVEPFLPN